MKKYIYVLLLSIFLLQGCKENEKITNRTDSSIDSIKDWKNVYKSFLLKMSEDISDTIEFSIKDLDNNLIPELIIKKHGTCLHIYSCDRGELIDVGENEFYSATTRFFYSNNRNYPGIFFFTIGGGLEQYGYLEFVNNKLVECDLWNEDYSGTHKNRERINEISDDKSCIEESRKIVAAGKDIEFDEVSEDSIKSKIHND